MTQRKRACGAPSGMPAQAVEQQGDVGTVDRSAGHGPWRRRRSAPSARPGAPPSASTSRPESSARAGSCAVRRQRARLEAGVGEIRVAGLLDRWCAGDRRRASAAPRPTRRAARGTRAACRRCWVATTRFTRRDRPALLRCSAVSSAMASLPSAVSAIELLGRERLRLGRALDLDELSVAGHDEVHVDLGLAVLLRSRGRRAARRRRCRR